MTALLWTTVLLVQFISEVSGQQSACGDNSSIAVCNCVTNSDGTWTVDCTGLGLGALPGGIPLTTSYLGTVWKSLMMMMSSSQDPMVRRGSASSHTYADGSKSTGTSANPLHHSESNQKEGYINGVIRKLTGASNSITNDGTCSRLDMNVDSSPDMDSVTSTVSVAALRGRFETVSSFFDSINKRQTSEGFCDANSNSLNVKNSKGEVVIANIENEGTEGETATMMKDDETEAVIINVEETEAEKETVNSIATTETVEMAEETKVATTGDTSVEDTRGETIEDTTGGTMEETTVETISSSDEELADYELECKTFMKDLVRRIFHESGSITQIDNHKFDQYCLTAEGRKWFARLVDGKRVYDKCVAEQTFYRLVQFFAVCLFECKEADDFTPAMHLMNMCFTFYHKQEGIPRSEDITHQSYLYSHLSNQKIWRDQRFWTAAFMDSVHSEKKKRMPTGRENWRNQTQEERENTELLHENITFGQLAAFTHNMMHLGLPRTMCQEFVDKQSVIGSLNDFQIEMLIGNINAHYKEEKVEEAKLVTSLQKSLNKIKQKIPGIL